MPSSDGRLAWVSAEHAPHLLVQCRPDPPTPPPQSLSGDYVKGGYFPALTATCGFVKGECFIVTFEPQGLFDHTAEWHVVDVTEVAAAPCCSTLPAAARSLLTLSVLHRMLLALACSLFLLFCTLFALNASCSIRSLLQHTLPASPLALCLPSPL